jgi:DNA-directed RNA polymerase sigma subunit (sigma70/sigma32)
MQDDRFGRGMSAERRLERAQEMANRYKKGETLAQIGRAYDRSAERVRQILIWHQRKLRAVESES